MNEETVSIQERAKRMGHVPQEDFRGQPENWVDAETFVRLAEESLPIAKGTIRVMEKKMSEQEQLLRDQKASIEAMRGDFAEFVEFSKSAEKRAYEKAVKEIQTKQRDAVNAGDVDAFDKATAELDARLSSHPMATGKISGSTVKADPMQQWLNAEPGVFEEWVSENDWFSEDPEMFAFANQVDQFLQSKHGLSKSRRERLAEIASRVKKKFPDYFSNSARKTGSPVEGDTGGPRRSEGKRSYHDLPAEAKKLCDKWTGKTGDGKSGTIPGLTREEYVKNYEW